MKLSDVWTMALLNLGRRKLRAGLTALGMAVGATSILVMLSLGISLNAALTQNISQMGSLTVLQLSPGLGQTAAGETTVSGSAAAAVLTGQTVSSCRKLAHVTAVTPVVQAQAMLCRGSAAAWITLLGIDLTQAAQFDLQLPTQEKWPAALTKSPLAAVLSQDVATCFTDVVTGLPVTLQLSDLQAQPLQISFDSANFLPNPALLGRDPVSVKGRVFHLQAAAFLEQGEAAAYYQTAFVDYRPLAQLCRDNPVEGQIPHGYDAIWLKADDPANVAALADTLRQQGYQVFSTAEYIQSYQAQMRTIQGVLGAIGAVAMLVAAIGIINTMLTSIYERTAEIGVIKVLGCSLADIWRIFISESAFIGGAGGLAGLGLSWLLLLVCNRFLSGTLPLQLFIPWWLALGGVGFSAFVAVLAGLYPAGRAMRLSPLEAIRSL